MQTVHQPAVLSAPFAPLDRVAMHVVSRLNDALSFARIICHVEILWLSNEALLSLWQAGHPHSLGATDDAERDFWPATRLLAIAVRSADGSPPCLCLSRELLVGDDLIALWHARVALVRLAVSVLDASAAEDGTSEVRGACAVQIVALDAPDGAVIVEQYPRPRLLTFEEPLRD